MDQSDTDNVASSTAKSNMKLSIDSHLIKSSTEVLPDELKSLGVCSYNENDFEKGVLHQFNVQLATFELNKAQENLSKKRKSDQMTTEDGQLKSSTSTSNQALSVNEKIYLEKKARLESTLNDYNSYLLNQEENSSSDSVSSEIILNKLKEQGSKATEIQTRPTENGSKPKIDKKPKQKATSDRYLSTRTEFDSIFDEEDRSLSKKTPKRVDNAEKPASKDKSVDRVSFMRLMEEDSENELEDITESKKTPVRRNQSPKIQSNKSDPDYELDSSDGSSVEYTSDDGEESDDEKRPRRRRNKNCMDDGDDELFKARLAELEVYEKRGKVNKDDEIDDEESDNYQELDEVADEDIEVKVNHSNVNIKPVGLNTGQHFQVDNCFRVPETIWNHLYKFQKVGIKWLWELHNQRCGGILGKKLTKFKKFLLFEIV